MRLSSGRSLHSSGARKEGRGRWLSSRGVRRSTWCGRGWAGATSALKGISGDGGSVKVGAVDSGLASTRGSACSKERRVVELLDTAARRGVDGGRGYGEGVAAMARPWRGSARERSWGRMEVSWGFTARHGVHPSQQRGEEVKQGDGQLCGARYGRRRAPACLPGRQAARWSGAGLGRQVGRVLGAR